MRVRFRSGPGGIHKSPWVECPLSLDELRCSFHAQGYESSAIGKQLVVVGGTYGGYVEAAEYLPMINWPLLEERWSHLCAAVGELR